MYWYVRVPTHSILTGGASLGKSVKATYYVAITNAARHSVKLVNGCNHWLMGCCGYVVGCCVFEGVQCMWMCDWCVWCMQVGGCHVYFVMLHYHMRTHAHNHTKIFHTHHIKITHITQVFYYGGTHCHAPPPPSTLTNPPTRKRTRGTRAAPPTHPPPHAPPPPLPLITMMGGDTGVPTVPGGAPMRGGVQATGGGRGSPQPSESGLTSSGMWRI